MTSLFLTPIEFGNKAIEKLAPFIANKYQKALLVTGKGSIKKNNLYDDLKEQLAIANIELVEYFGIKPNPLNTQIDDAAKLGIKENVDLVIAAGGGSAIDAAKVIALMINNLEIKESWSLVTNKVKPTKQALDLITIISLAGTASENNAGSVVTNEKLTSKQSMATRKPVLCIADPAYTKSVSLWQTASGIFDAFSHTLEQFNSVKGSFNWTDNYNIATLKTLLTNAPLVMKNLQNEKARANILFASSMALNGLASFEMPSSDWSVHGIAHAIAAKYDTTHGATLALITPYYSYYRAQVDPIFKKRLLIIGKEVFNALDVDSTIKALKEFISILKLPQKWSDFKACKQINKASISNLTNFLARSVVINKKQIEDILLSIPI